MEYASGFGFDFVKSRKRAGPQKQRRAGTRPASLREVAFVGGSGLFSRKLPATRDASGQKLLDTFVFKSIGDKKDKHIL